MSNLNGIHHVIKHKGQLGSFVSYCGRTVWYYDMPIELDHAKSCIQQETYLQPCKKCIAKADKEQIDKKKSQIFVMGKARIQNIKNLFAIALFYFAFGVLVQSTIHAFPRDTTDFLIRVGYTPFFFSFVAFILCLSWFFRDDC